VDQQNALIALSDKLREEEVRFGHPPPRWPVPALHGLRDLPVLQKYCEKLQKDLDRKRQ
jgi:hypothetical protein